MQGKNGLDIHNQQEKGYQNVELFFLRFEKVLKIQASVSKRIIGSETKFRYQRGQLGGSLGTIL